MASHPEMTKKGQPLDGLVLLEQSEKAMEALYQYTKGVLALARASLTNATRAAQDDDEWLRMPVSPRRCPVSGWGRTTLQQKMNRYPNQLRSKLVGGCRFYSGADVRRFLKGPGLEEFLGEDVEKGGEG